MKLFIDTVNEDLFVSIIKDSNTLFFKHLVSYKKKSDILPEVFENLINLADIQTKDIEEIYVVNGPGSFMGIRAGLTFSKTISLLTKAKLFSIDNLTFISKKQDGEYFVDAKGGLSYRGIVKQGDVKIDICDFQENSLIDYKTLIDEPDEYLKNFKLVEDVINYEANYFKSPQVGGK